MSNSSEEKKTGEEEAVAVATGGGKESKEISFVVTTTTTTTNQVKIPPNFLFNKYLPNYDAYFTGSKCKEQEEGKVVTLGEDQSSGKEKKKKKNKNESVRGVLDFCSGDLKRLFGWFFMKKIEIDVDKRVEMQFKNGDVYRGFVNERINPNGFGIYVQSGGGVVYKGMFKDGKREGKGKEISKSLIFCGDWKNGKKNGNGMVKFKDDETVIIGNWEKDVLESNKARVEYANGEIYEGQIKNGIISGKGKIVYKNGDQYEGNFAFKKKHGYGIMTFKMKNKKNTIKPKEMMKKEICTYSGQFEEDHFHGFGTLLTPYDYYIGNWVKSKKHGLGEHYLYRTRQSCYCQFVNDMPKGPYQREFNPRYFLQEKNTGLVLTAGNSVILRQKTGKRNQQFTFDNTIIKCVGSGMVIDYNASKKSVSQEVERTLFSSSQSWYYDGNHFVSYSDNKSIMEIKQGDKIFKNFIMTRVSRVPIGFTKQQTYYIRNKYYGLYLSVKETDKKEGKEIVELRKLDLRDPSQKWRFNGHLRSDYCSKVLLLRNDNFVLVDPKKESITNDNVFFDGNIFLFNRLRVMAGMENGSLISKKWRSRISQYENEWWEITNNV